MNRPYAPSTKIIALITHGGVKKKMNGLFLSLETQLKRQSISFGVLVQINAFLDQLQSYYLSVPLTSPLKCLQHLPKLGSFLELCFKCLTAALWQCHYRQSESTIHRHIDTTATTTATTATTTEFCQKEEERAYSAQLFELEHKLLKCVSSFGNLHESIESLNEEQAAARDWCKALLSKHNYDNPNQQQQDTQTEAFIKTSLELEHILWSMRHSSSLATRIFGDPPRTKRAKFGIPLQHSFKEKSNKSGTTKATTMPTSPSPTVATSYSSSSASSLLLQAKKLQNTLVPHFGMGGETRHVIRLLLAINSNIKEMVPSQQNRYLLPTDKKKQRINHLCSIVLPQNRSKNNHKNSDNSSKSHQTTRSMLDDVVLNNTVLLEEIKSNKGTKHKKEVQEQEQEQFLSKSFWIAVDGLYGSCLEYLQDDDALKGDLLLNARGDVYLKRVVFHHLKQFLCEGYNSGIGTQEKDVDGNSRLPQPPVCMVRLISTRSTSIKSIINLVNATPQLVYPIFRTLFKLKGAKDRFLQLAMDEFIFSLHSSYDGQKMAHRYQPSVGTWQRIGPLLTFMMKNKALSGYNVVAIPSFNDSLSALGCVSSLIQLRSQAQSQAREPTFGNAKIGVYLRAAANHFAFSHRCPPLGQMFSFQTARCVKILLLVTYAHTVYHEHVSSEVEKLKFKLLTGLLLDHDCGKEVMRSRRNGGNHNNANAFIVQKAAYFLHDLCNGSMSLDKFSWKKLSSKDLDPSFRLLCIYSTLLWWSMWWSTKNTSGDQHTEFFRSCTQYIGVEYLIWLLSVLRKDLSLQDMKLPTTITVALENVLICIGVVIDACEKEAERRGKKDDHVLSFWTKYSTSFKEEVVDLYSSSIVVDFDDDDDDEENDDDEEEGGRIALRSH
eukprot:m.73278 g.73278  ORF g.73278 m.73278 type:complete len:889 (+) comp8414_c0_seq2:116-2782(+)